LTFWLSGLCWAIGRQRCNFSKRVLGWYRGRRRSSERPSECDRKELTQGPRSAQKPLTTAGVATGNKTGDSVDSTAEGVDGVDGVGTECCRHGSRMDQVWCRAVV
jgi:hypothetical protein